MKKISFKTNNSHQTKKLGFLLGKDLQNISSKNKLALIIALKGELGSGKTTFIKGLAKSLKIKKPIVSPTFLIIKKYPLKTKKFNYLYHLDLYRLKNFQELLDLDFEKIINNKKNIVIMEWADKIKKYLPKTTLWLLLKHQKKENERKIIFQII